MLLLPSLIGAVVACVWAVNGWWLGKKSEAMAEELVSS